MPDLYEPCDQCDGRGNCTSTHTLEAIKDYTGTPFQTRCEGRCIFCRGSGLISSQDAKALRDMPGVTRVAATSETECSHCPKSFVMENRTDHCPHCGAFQAVRGKGAVLIPKPLRRWMFDNHQRAYMEVGKRNDYRKWTTQSDIFHAVQGTTTPATSSIHILSHPGAKDEWVQAALLHEIGHNLQYAEDWSAAESKPEYDREGDAHERGKELAGQVGIEWTDAHDLASQVAHRSYRTGQVQRHCVECKKVFSESEHGEATGFCSSCREKEGLVTHHSWSEDAQEGHYGHNDGPDERREALDNWSTYGNFENMDDDEFHPLHHMWEEARPAGRRLHRALNLSVGAFEALKGMNEVNLPLASWTSNSRIAEEIVENSNEAHPTIFHAPPSTRGVMNPRNVFEGEYLSGGKFHVDRIEGKDPHHVYLTPVGEKTAAMKADDIPPAPGTAPIPEGHVRIYHATWADPEAIKRTGLSMKKARESYERGSTEYPAIFGYAGHHPALEAHRGGGGANVVEFHLHPDDLDVGHFEKPEYLEGARSTVTTMKDVRPENIVAVHEPWHAQYRMITEDPRIRKEVLDGVHDWALEDEGMKPLGDAIRKFKREATRATICENCLGTGVLSREDDYKGRCQHGEYEGCAMCEKQEGKRCPDCKGSGLELNQPTIEDLMKERQERRERLATMEHVDSPLAADYKHPGVKRISIRDENFPGDPDHPYFKEPGTVAFVDYTPMGDDVFIDYASTHESQQGRGHASRLTDQLYDRFPGEVNWGKIMEPAMGKLYERHKAHPEHGPRTRGKNWYSSTSKCADCNGTGLSETASREDPEVDDFLESVEDYHFMPPSKREASKPVAPTAYACRSCGGTGSAGPPTGRS